MLIAGSQRRDGGARPGRADLVGAGGPWARWAALGLVVYSLALLSAEWVGGPPLARDLCGDFLGMTRFHGVNTTLSVFLLSAGALLLVFTVATRVVDRRERRYFLAQAALLGWLAVDDRFLVHETLGERTGVPDALILFASGLVQLGVLWRMARLPERSARARRLLLAAAGAFALMCVVDATQHAFDWPGRMTTEDLAKTWGCACLFGFVWSVCARPLGGATAAR